MAQVSAPAAAASGCNHRNFEPLESRRKVFKILSDGRVIKYMMLWFSFEVTRSGRSQVRVDGGSDMAAKTLPTLQRIRGEAFRKDIAVANFGLHFGGRNHARFQQQLRDLAAYTADHRASAIAVRMHF